MECKSCSSIKGIKQFSSRNLFTNGTTGICNDCHRIRSLKYSRTRRMKIKNGCSLLFSDVIESRKTSNRKYQMKHKDVIKEKRRSNPKRRLYSSISAGVYTALRGGKHGRRWESIVGYTLTDLVAHLESLFTEGMTFDNYGEWHIDHIIPVSVFNFSTVECLDFKKCWSLSNLQPLWASENQVKWASLTGPFQPSLNIKA